MQSQQTQGLGLKLPERLVTAVDLARTLRELKKLDDWLTQANLRAPGQAVSPPKTSATLEDVAQINGVSLLDTGQRQQLISVLEAFSEHAPRVHMSFAVEPSANFLNHMIVWMRSNISPLTLLQIGMQPTLAAGCTVRTENKLFDLSLRHRFVESRSNLVASIASVEGVAAEALPEITAPDVSQIIDATTSTEGASNQVAQTTEPVIESTAEEQSASPEAVSEVEPVLNQPSDQTSDLGVEQPEDSIPQVAAVDAPVVVENAESTSSEPESPVSSQEPVS